jgi:hypothetical protein
MEAGAKLEALFDEGVFFRFFPGVGVVFQLFQCFIGSGVHFVYPACVLGFLFRGERDGVGFATLLAETLPFFF